MTNWGLLRRGLGQADLTKTRAERHVELKALLLCWAADAVATTT